jgi:hypothetical protein
MLLQNINCSHYGKGTIIIIGGGQGGGGHYGHQQISNSILTLFLSIISLKIAFNFYNSSKISSDTDSLLFWRTL